MPPNTPAQYLYMAQEDLYRLGNSGGPRFDNVRGKDIETYDRNGVVFVRANGKGLSLLTEERAATTPGWLWKIPKATPMPVGLALNADGPGHVSLCPNTDMPLDSYRGLLSTLAVHCLRVKKQ